MKCTLINRIKPSGSVRLPPSKSEAIRAALLLALAGEDPEEAAAGFPAPFCADLSRALEAAGDLRSAYVGESAALMRFLIPIQAALFGRISLRADEALLRRGFAEIEECLGTSLAPEPGTGLIEARAELEGTRFEIDCSRSSQFVSGLIMALPLLPRECDIIIRNGLVSRPYADMTLRFMRLFGGRAEETAEGFRTYPSRYAVPERLLVAGDASLAAVYEAMDLMGGSVEIIGGGADTLQPDGAFQSLAGLDECDITDCPDLLPVLAACACAKRGDTVIRGTRRLRTKESDREAGVVKLINDLGGSARVGENCVIVHGAGSLRGGDCGLLRDHRLAFAAALAAMICDSPVTLRGAECVAKSAPRFWEDYAELTKGAVRREEEESE